VVELALDTLDGIILINEPTNSVPSRMDNAALRQLCKKHRIPVEDTLLPSCNDRANNPPEGYIPCSCYICTARCVPPFNAFIHQILFASRLVLTQLHLNGYAFHSGTYIAFHRIIERSPTYEDICRIYCFKR